MTKSSVNNIINNKKGRGGHNEIKFPSPKKDEDVKKGPYNNQSRPP
jgi:hypothetical protein